MAWHRRWAESFEFPMVLSGTFIFPIGLRTLTETIAHEPCLQNEQPGAKLDRFFSSATSGALLFPIELQTLIEVITDGQCWINDWVGPDAERILSMFHWPCLGPYVFQSGP
jgi:hypothetical protein